MTHIFLFLVLCMDQQCTERQGFIRDHYEAPASAVADARADCEYYRKAGAAFLSAYPRKGEGVYCVTEKQIAAMGFSK